MRIGVLGPLAVRTEQGEPVEVAGARLRTLAVRAELADAVCGKSYLDGRGGRHRRPAGRPPLAPRRSY